MGKLLKYKLPLVCPNCIGVGGTWLVLSTLVVYGYLERPDWELGIGILMGGSVVGIAYQGEKHYQWPRMNPVWWKTLDYVIGFPLVYLAVTNLSQTVIALEVVFFATVFYLYFLKPWQRPHDQSTPSELEKKLKDCC